MVMMMMMMRRKSGKSCVFLGELGDRRSGRGGSRKKGVWLLCFHS
jgi:hypothetical protein